MNLHFTFSIREISQVRDSEQRLKIPMYFSVEWEVREGGRELTMYYCRQEVRLTVNTNHTSWEDDSTGPKGENTEEAEVKYFGKYLLYKIQNIF